MTPPLQLHSFVLDPEVLVDSFNSFLFIDAMFGRQLYDSLLVDLLKIFFKSVFPKCLLIKDNSLDPVLLKGGFNQIMFLVSLAVAL